MYHKMDAAVWGPHAWFFLHSIAFSYPWEPSKVEQAHAIAFFKSLKSLLPCIICQLHYTDHLKESELKDAVTSRRKLVEWVHRLHNKVNQSLGKPELSIDQMVTFFETAYHPPSRWLPSSSLQKCGIGALILVLIVALIIVGIFMYKHVQKCFVRCN